MSRASAMIASSEQWVGEENEAVYEPYRALSSAAVVSVMLGALGSLTYFHVGFGLIAVAGLCLGIYAIRSIRAQSDELTGGQLARAGTLLSAVTLFGGWGYHGFVYATEVPDGYERISYSLLQPPEGAPATSIPRPARALEGKKVFIKGYVYPGLQTKGIKEFLLVRDKGDCCFGGNPKISDRIQVRLQDPLRLNFSDRQFRVAGIFRIEPAKAVDGPGGVLYHLDADYLQ